MMTEDEAKEKWCPQTNAPAIPYGSAGDGPPEDDYIAEVSAISPCIGSACMAWRRGREMFQLESGRLVDPRDGILGDIKYKRVRLGYCGLAGQP